jgi:hypothetical protein
VNDLRVWQAVVVLFHTGAILKVWWWGKGVIVCTKMAEPGNDNTSGPKGMIEHSHGMWL